MIEVVCKATVHKRGGARNLPYILRDEAAQEPAAQAREGREKESVSELAHRASAGGLDLEPAHQLEFTFPLGAPPPADEDLTLDDDPIFTWNVPEFVTGDPYGKDWSEEAGDGGTSELGKGNKLTLAEKRLNAEIHFGLRAEYEESKGGVSHHRLVVTVNETISNQQLKRLVLRFLREGYPNSEALISLHRNTGERKTHAHIHVNSRQLDGRRVDLKQRYFKLDELWAKSCADHFHEPRIYERHIAKKEETRQWQGQYRAAKERQQIPPLKPDREADHHGTKYPRPFNDRWVGRQIAKERLAQKKLEFLTVTEAPKKVIRAARKQAAQHTALVEWALARRKEGKKDAKNYVPTTLGTIKEGREFATYERAIKAAHTREMTAHMVKAADDYLKNITEVELQAAAKSPEVAAAHTTKIMALRMELLKEHNLTINRTEWTAEGLKAEGRERLQERIEVALTRMERNDTAPVAVRGVEAPARPIEVPAGTPQQGRQQAGDEAKARLLLAVLNEAVEHHVFERGQAGLRLSQLRSEDPQYEWLLYDLKGVVLAHCAGRGLSLQELNLTDRDIDEALKSYVERVRVGDFKPPFGRGERVRDVERAERRREVEALLARDRPRTRELAEAIAGAQRGNGHTPTGAPPADRETARLHAGALLAALRLDAVEAAAAKYKHYCLFEQMMVADRYNTLHEWSLAQGKYLAATTLSYLKERHWEDAPRVAAAVTGTEQQVGQTQEKLDVAVKAAGGEYQKHSAELVAQVRMRGAGWPELPKFTAEQSRAADELLYMTFSTDALESLSRVEEAHDLRSAAARAGARYALALVYQGEDQERQRVADNKIGESLKYLPAGAQLGAELQAYLAFRQVESARLEKFVATAQQISERLQLRCEAQLGEQLPTIFRVEEAAVVKAKLPAMEQKERERLTKELNKGAFTMAAADRLTVAKFSAVPRNDYDKLCECDLKRDFETARVLVR